MATARTVFKTVGRGLGAVLKGVGEIAVQVHEQQARVIRRKVERAAPTPDGLRLCLQDLEAQLVAAPWLYEQHRQLHQQLQIALGDYTPPVTL
jgi:hypothetical protein